MKKTIVAMFIAMVVAGSLVFASDVWKAPIYGSFISGSGSYTNLNRERVEIASVTITGPLAGGVAVIALTANSGAVTNVLATNATVTTSLSYYDEGGNAFPFEPGAVLQFTTAYTNTVWYTIYTK